MNQAGFSCALENRKNTIVLDKVMGMVLCFNIKIHHSLVTINSSTATGDVDHLKPTYLKGIKGRRYLYKKRLLKSDKSHRIECKNGYKRGNRTT